MAEWVGLQVQMITLEYIHVKKSLQVENQDNKECGGLEAYFLVCVFSICIHILYIYN